MKSKKERLVELIGMAEILEVELRDLGMESNSVDAVSIVNHLKNKFNKICGEEELARMRGDKYEISNSTL